MRAFLTVAVLLSSAAFGQSFDAANKYLFERSSSRACDGFRAFLKANPSSPLAREAQAKAAHACMQVGKSNWAELQKIATTGEKDYGRAYAAFALAERGGSFDAALKLLEQATGDSGRVGKEATGLLLRGAFADMDRNSWNATIVEARAALVLAHTKDPTSIARARFARARAHLNNQKTLAAGEEELRSVGSGSTEWADDALYLLGNRRENEQKFVEALALYDEIGKRFDNSSSNVKRDAENRAREIRRPWVSVGVSSVDLPGVKPQISASWRNVKNAQWQLIRVDPMALDAENGLPWPSDEGRLLRASRGVASKWTATLDEKVKHAQGSSSFELEVKSPGLYVLELAADGQKAQEWVLVTRTATLTKSDMGTVLVWVSDVETGEARAGAEVALFIDENGRDRKLTGKTDATGIARFTVGDSANRSMLVYTRSGDDVSLSRAGNGYKSSWNSEELAYVLFDRPLYKPGETVGLKLFLRVREGGPSTPLARRSAKVTVTDATGKKVSEAELVTNDFGTAETKVALPKTASLGQYYVSIDGHGKYYRANTSTFRVEEYKPPEYVVTVEPLAIPKPGEVAKFKVKAKYYSGGAVAKAKGRAIVTVQGWNHTWAPWPDERTNDDDNGGYGYDEEYGYRGRRGYYRPWYGQLASHTLQFVTGDDGTAEVEVPALPNPPGMDLQYQVQVFVTDASRREIQGSGTLHASSSPYFADLRTDHFLYRPGERVNVKLRAEDANGKPASPDLVVRLMRIAEDGKATKIAETRTKAQGGSGLVQLDADALGQVRAEVAATDKPDTVLAQTEVWLTSDTRPMTPPHVGFQMYLDRAPLKAGEKARVLVVTNTAGGHALLTTEGESVTSATVLEMKGRARFVEVPLSAAMTPNVYLTLSRFENTQVMQQQRMLKVQGSEVALDVKVSFDKAIAEPGTAVMASIAALNAKAGLKLETALTIVDEALFYIEPEKKDFMSFFGRLPRQLTVRTNNSFNERWYRPRPQPQHKQPTPDTPSDMERRSEEKPSEPSPAKAARVLADAPASAAPAAEAEESLGGLASGRGMGGGKMKRESKKDSAGEDDRDLGGPGGSGAAPVKVRTDFGSSSGWYPALAGSGAGALKQRVQLTDSLTSWKAVATVVSSGPHLGQGSASLRTEKPLMVRLQAPRFFVEGDEVVLSAVVESQLTKTAQVDVAIGTTGFKALSPPRARLTVEPGKAQRFDARFKVTDVGEQTIRAIVKGAGAGDAMEWKLPAFVHGSAQRAYAARRLDDSVKFEFEVPEKRKADLTRLELTLSPSLLAVMFDGLPYLAQYPYGCVEQTLSRFVPATIARRAVKDLSLPADRVPENLDDMTQKGLERLADFQHGDGGWGWWKADSTNNWMTAYVVYALSLAKEAGLDVNDSMVARGRGYLVSHLGEAQKAPETHAFMVFALSQTGKVPAQAVNKAFANRTRLSAKGRALVALALLAQKDKRARIAVENLDDVVKAAQARNDAAVGEANDVWSTSEAIEATAFTLMAMARYDKGEKLVAPLTDFLVLRRNGGKWRTTRDTAFAIYALSDLARLEKANQSTGSFGVYVNGKLVKRIAYGKGGLDLKEPLVLSDKALKAGTNEVEIRRDGGGTGYAAATLDVFNMNDFIKGVGGDVKVKRSYTLLGKPSTEKSAAPTEYGMPVESGVRMRVDLEVTANKAVEFVMIEDLKPAGFEAVMQRSGPEVCNYACAHAELRVDRVAMFLSSISVGTTKLSYELRAEVPGKFAALPARAEAMYAPEIQATADEMRFEVRDEPGGVAAQ